MKMKIQMTKPRSTKLYTVDPNNKEKHKERRVKKLLLQHLSIDEWKQEVEDYKNNKKDSIEKKLF